MPSDFVRYLKAKRSVDDRAMDRRVWDRLRREVLARGPELTIADVGAGIGVGLARMVEWGLFDGLDGVRYVAIEPDEELASNDIDPEAVGVGVEKERVTAALEDLERVRGPARDGRFDLVVAHAVLDILDLEPSLDRLVAMTRRGGLLYLPITFDGETIWEPGLDADETISSAYHDTMKRRGRTGRLLCHALEQRGASVLSTASSDWIVAARNGSYHGDEAFFLEFLLDTVEGALQGRIPSTVLEAWLAERRRQLAACELLLIAHQLDVLAERT